MTDVPSLRAIESGAALLRDGYTFIHRRSQLFHSDVFCGRLLGQPVIFMTGSESARVFYDAERFRRADAVPLLVQETLFGRGGVQVLDGEAHRERKAAFMSLMTPSNLERFVDIAEREWRSAVSRWEQSGRVVLFDEARRVLCRSACLWSGVVTGDRELERVMEDCTAMVDGFASVGPRMLRALVARRRAERWARDVIVGVRCGRRVAEPGSAAQVFAQLTNAAGERVSERTAAVELLNIVRPTTALAFWVSFAALALEEYPGYRERLAADDALVRAFVQEVRRFYPFTPFLGARARSAFEWRGVRFSAGQLAILDVYGTLRDPRSWQAPNEFRPERFLDAEPPPFAFIPQGGGDFFAGHRCAGEWLSVQALEQAVKALTRMVRYELPAQDLSYSLARIPARPASGVVLRGVERLDAVDPSTKRAESLTNGTARSSSVRAS